MTKPEAIARIQEEERRLLLLSPNYVRSCVEAGKSVGFYECCFYYVPRKVLTEQEEWDAFVEANRSAISEIVGYPVNIEVEGDIGNGHGAWVVTRQEGL